MPGLSSADQPLPTTKEATTPVDSSQSISPIESQTVIGTPAEGMDLDSRYQTIKDELRQKWLDEHPDQDIFSFDAQNYTLGYVDPKQRHIPTLKSDTENAFREKYNDDARAYDEKEKSRVYENPSRDPVVINT